MSTEEYCVHDMVKAWCADCQAKSYTPAKPAPVAPSSPNDSPEPRIIEASYPGRCQPCGGFIHPGEQIAQVEDGSWIHADCI